MNNNFTMITTYSKKPLLFRKKSIMILYMIFITFIVYLYFVRFKYTNLVFMLQQTLELAVKLGLINKNIARQVGNVKKCKQKIDFWTKEDAEKVFSTFDINNYYDRFSFTLIYTLFMTGLRLGEAQALEWNDIDFEEKTLRVNKNMYYKNANEFYITETKTPASNRVIALDDTTIYYLSQWKTIQEKIQLQIMCFPIIAYLLIKALLVISLHGTLNWQAFIE